MKVLFAGGGTGGHVYPALAIARHLQRTHPEFECLFLGTAQGLEREIVPREGFPLHCIPGSGFRRLGLRARLRFFWTLMRGFFSAVSLVRRYGPDVVLASGGYASLAGGLAAVVLRRPLCVQEQNSVPGHAARLLGGMAREVFVGFPKTERFFRHPSRVRYVGNPVREDLLVGVRTLDDVPADRPVVLVVGGSRGARSINRAVDEAIPRLSASHRVFWLWQTGRLDHAEFQTRWSDHADVRLWDYLSDVGAAYGSATLVVCRAGAMTLAELTALGKPALLVPFPGAVDDHQTANARHLVDGGAAVLVPDAQLDGARLAEEIERLLAAPEQLESMAARSRALARPKATSEIAQALREIATRTR